MQQLSFSQRIGILVIVSVFAAAVLFSFPPIPQDPAYHDFVDTRGWLGIPNVGDVASNLPFLLTGVLGLLHLHRRWHDREAFFDPRERIFHSIFFAGIALVAFGSGYYHWSPANATLVWDRLPMTLGFMSLFAAILAERIHMGAGLALLPLLLLAGIASVFYWDATEQQGAGDLRPYALVQFLPIVLIPLTFRLFAPRYSHTRYFWQIVGWYLLAKLLEHFDGAVFSLLGGMVSGHTLKHLAAAMATYGMVRWIRDRKTL